MKIFGKGLKPAWTFKTDKKVWRLLPGSGVLAVEFRDTEAKVADYSGFDLASGSPLWHGLSLPDSWWVVMNRVFRDSLLLQQFVRPDMPTPGKIFAVDLFSGKIIWENHEVSYLAAAGDVIYALKSSIQSEEIVGLDYRTGAERVSFPADDPRAEALSVMEQDTGFVLPKFPEEVEGDLAPARFEMLVNAVPEGARNATFITALSGSSIIGFHSDAGTDEKGIHTFDAHIKVIDKNGKTIFNDIADRRVYTAMSDFYFVAGGFLVYVRNSNEIVAVRPGD
jgi:Domain of unknown function (DUF4905)